MRLGSLLVAMGLALYVCAALIPQAATALVILALFPLVAGLALLSLDDGCCEGCAAVRARLAELALDEADQRRDLDDLIATTGEQAVIVVDPDTTGPIPAVDPP